MAHTAWRMLHVFHHHVCKWLQAELKMRDFRCICVVYSVDRFLAYFWLQIWRRSRSEECTDMTMSISDGRADGSILRASVTASGNSPLMAHTPSLTATASKRFSWITNMHNNIGQQQNPDKNNQFKRWKDTVSLISGLSKRLGEMLKVKCAQCLPLVDIFQAWNKWRTQVRNTES